MSHAPKYPDSVKSFRCVDEDEASVNQRSYVDVPHRPLCEQIGMEAAAPYPNDRARLVEQSDLLAHVQALRIDNLTPSCAQALD
jgi:hypothetical protein